MSRPVDEEEPSLLLILLDASCAFWTKREAARRRQDQVKLAAVPFPLVSSLRAEIEGSAPELFLKASRTNVFRLQLQLGRRSRLVSL